MKYYLKKYYIHTFIILLTIFIFANCISQNEQLPRKKNGRLYGEIKHFKHRWYHYYKRGLSYAEGEFYSEASYDFYVAIKKKSEDKRKARTYGFHFIDYFPHRELGIIHYHQGSYAKAIKHLQISLSTEKSARAEYYLDLVRKQQVLSKNSDREPPEIILSSPGYSCVTNATSIYIKGYAQDDTFVKDISIGKQTVRMDISKSKKNFTKKIPLKSGKNEIHIQAIDISGKIANIKYTVNVDRIGPVIVFDQPAEGYHVVNNKIDISGIIYDDNALESLIINGHKQKCNDTSQIEVQQTLLVKPSQQAITICAKDSAGNQTFATLVLSDQQKDSGIETKRLIAGDYMTDDVTQSFYLAQNISDTMSLELVDSIFPKINLRFPNETKVTFLDFMYLEGSIQDNKMVTHLSVNGEDILRVPGKKIFFNHLIPLQTGKNIITVMGIDASGNTVSKTIKANRKVPDAKKIETRLKIAITKFDRELTSNSVSKSIGFEELLYIEMKNKRFNLIHPQKFPVLKDKEQGYKEKMQYEESTIHAAKAMNADCVMFGKITEYQNCMAIYIRLVDTELPDQIEDIAVDVYTEDADRDKLFTLAHGLNFKLADELPLVEGSIQRIIGEKIFVDIGKDDNIKRGMKLIVYQIIVHKDLIINEDKKEETFLWEIFSNIGQARIQSVNNQKSLASLMKDVKLPNNKEKQHIITK